MTLSLNGQAENGHEAASGGASGEMPKGLDALRRFAKRRAATEVCDFCSAPLGREHQHLIHPDRPGIVCACDGCALLFDSDGETNYRRVPRDSWSLPNFQLSDELWAELGVPVDVVFFLRGSKSNRVMGIYPSPAGATESLPREEAWARIEQDNPVLRRMKPGVEALLVNRTGGVRRYYLVPIDRCYKLVGLLRTAWTGWSGGQETWAKIRHFFEDLDRKAGPIREERHA